MHGGAIGFASNAGSGSTFSFYIKGRRSQPSTSSVGERLYGHTPYLAERPANGTAKAANGSAIVKPDKDHGHEDEFSDDLYILIVEDNLVNQRVLSKQLQRLGMKVAVANHGEEALDYLRTTKFCTSEESRGKDLSLILMDWEMPVMDGLSCVRHIRQLQKDGTVQGHVPVIAVTANVREEQVKAAIEAGMDDIVSKPFRIPELCTRIRKLIRAKAS
jgi:CheY-like chemotaxis protein